VPEVALEGGVRQLDPSEDAAPVLGKALEMCLQGEAVLQFSIAPL